MAHSEEPSINVKVVPLDRDLSPRIFEIVGTSNIEIAAPIARRKFREEFPGATIFSAKEATKRDMRKAVDDTPEDEDEV